MQCPPKQHAYVVSFSLLLVVNPIYDLDGRQFHIHYSSLLRTTTVFVPSKFVRVHLTESMQHSFHTHLNDGKNHTIQFIPEVNSYSQWSNVTGSSKKVHFVQLAERKCIQKQSRALHDYNCHSYRDSVKPCRPNERNKHRRYFSTIQSKFGMCHQLSIFI